MSPIHVVQIQMQSGLTGINTLRIYNPVKQGQDHDPSGEFIRHWVPELRGLAGSDVHEPWKLPEQSQVEGKCRLGVDYPLPIVDHREAVRHARACFSALRQRDDYWESAQMVMQRHGSRKRAFNRTRPNRSQLSQSPQIELALTHSSNDGRTD